jgi:hypothetical protein
MPLKGVDQGPTGAVLRVQHPTMAMGSLQCGAQQPILMVKGHSQLKETLHAGGGVAHQKIDCWLITQTSSSPDGVGHVALQAVL